VERGTKSKPNKTLDFDQRGKSHHQWSNSCVCNYDPLLNINFDSGSEKYVYLVPIYDLVLVLECAKFISTLC